jgi:hypothetical protein
MPCFLFITDDAGKAQLININQITFLQTISEDHIRITFAPTLNIEIHGKNATEILAYCMLHTVLPDGTPLTDAMSESDKKATS